MEDFVKQCMACNHPHIRPNQEVLIKPGGQMRHAMAGHRGALKSLDLKKDGKVAVTCKFSCIESLRKIESTKNFQKPHDAY